MLRIVLWCLMGIIVVMVGYTIYTAYGEYRFLSQVFGQEDAPAEEGVEMDDEMEIELIDETVSADIQIVREALNLADREAAVGLFQLLEDDGTEEYEVLSYDISVLQGDLERAKEIAQGAILEDDQAVDWYDRMFRVMVLLRDDEGLLPFVEKYQNAGGEESHVWLMTEFLSDPAQAVEDLGLQGENPVEVALVEARREWLLFEKGREEHLDLLMARAVLDTYPHISLRLADMALEKRPEYRDAWLTYGFAALRLEQYETASRVLEEAFRLDITQAQTSYLLGVAQLYNDEAFSAVESLERAERLEYEERGALQAALQKAYTRIGEVGQAAVAGYQLLTSVSEVTESMVEEIYFQALESQNDSLLSDLTNLATERSLQNARTLQAHTRYVSGGSVTIDPESLPDSPHVFLLRGLLHEEDQEYAEAFADYADAYNTGKNTPAGQVARGEYESLLERVQGGG